MLNHIHHILVDFGFSHRKASFCIGFINFIVASIMFYVTQQFTIIISLLILIIMFFIVFAVLFLNRANRIKHFEIISSGGMTGTIADPRIILKKALEEEAVSIILCHNHPSGNLKPSKADEEITFKIRNAAKFFDIQVLDHIIVSTEGYYSYAEQSNNW